MLLLNQADCSAHILMFNWKSIWFFNPFNWGRGKWGWGWILLLLYISISAYLFFLLIYCKWRKSNYSILILASHCIIETRMSSIWVFLCRSVAAIPILFYYFVEGEVGEGKRDLGGIEPQWNESCIYVWKRMNFEIDAILKLSLTGGNDNDTILRSVTFFQLVKPAFKF